MHARRLIAAAAVAVLTLVVAAASPATAGGSDDHAGTPFVDGDAAGYELEGIRELGQVLTGPGVPSWLRDCNHRTWELLEKESYFAIVYGGRAPTAQEIIDRGDDPTQPWNAVFCTPGPGASGVTPEILFTGVLSTWIAGDPPPQIFIDWIIAYGYSLVRIPLQIGSSSPAGDVDAPLIAQLDTWLWIDPTVWATRSATTPPVFGVTATVTAEPYSVEFSTSEGHYLDCAANVGVVYDYSRPATAQSTSCSVVYRDASSVADQTLVSTVRWAVSYVCSSAACPSGTLPDFVITTTRDVRVAEVIGVGTETGS
jgi:hypothetical protein